jgi:hypothetical protein
MDSNLFFSLLSLSFLSLSFGVFFSCPFGGFRCSGLFFELLPLGRFF